MDGGSIPTSVITAASTQADYAAMTERLMWDLLTFNSQTVTDASKNVVWDGKFMQPMSSVPNIEIQFAWAAGLAVLRRYKGSPKTHWSVKYISSAVEALLATQTNTGGFLDSNTNNYPNDFIIAQLCETIIYMRDAVSPATLKRWTRAAVRAGNHMFTQPAGSPEAAFYVNGNREAQELMGYWWLYRLTGAAIWLSRYNDQYTFMIKPPSGAGSSMTPTPMYFGLKTITAGVTADGSDAKGYLQERDPNKPTPPYNQNGFDGYDDNYSMLSNSFVARGYMYNGDIRLLRIINMQLNQLMDPTRDRVNTTTWNVDGSGGSRQNNGGPMVPAPCFVSTWKGGRNQFSAADLAGIWNANQVLYSGNIDNPSPNIYRGLNLDLGSILMATNQWPALTG